MADQKSTNTRHFNLPSYSESEATRPATTESIPSAPYSYNEPPPTYEESLRQHIGLVAGNLNQGLQNPGNQPAENFGNYNCKDYGNDKEAASKYPKQPQSLTYPQQTTQFRSGHQNIIPGSQLYMQPPFYHGQQVIIPNVFEDGARFNSVAPPSIPPPPPGVAPNAAQLAVQRGATVVTSQKQSSFLTGGKGAGFTFW